MHLYTLTKHTRFYASGLKFSIHALLWTFYRSSNSLIYDSYEIFILNHLVFFLGNACALCFILKNRSYIKRNSSFRDLVELSRFGDNSKDSFLH